MSDDDGLREAENRLRDYVLREFIAAPNKERTEEARKIIKGMIDERFDDLERRVDRLMGDLSQKMKAEIRDQMAKTRPNVAPSWERSGYSGFDLPRPPASQQPGGIQRTERGQLQIAPQQNDLYLSQHTQDQSRQRAPSQYGQKAQDGSSTLRFGLAAAVVVFLAAVVVFLIVLAIYEPRVWKSSTDSAPPSQTQSKDGFSPDEGTQQ